MESYSLLLCYPSLCSYTPEKNIGYHYFVLLPLDNKEILSILITSKIEKRKEYNKKHGLGEIIEVDNTIKGFEKLKIPSAIDVSNQCIITELIYNKLNLKAINEFGL
jgi:hypothetical protein